MPPRKPMDDWKRRARAAAALADIDYKDLAPKLGFSLSTLDRQLANRATRRGRRIAEGVARDVAQECGLPYEFFTADFELLETDETVRRVERLQAAVSRLSLETTAGRLPEPTAVEQTEPDVALDADLAELGREPEEEEPPARVAGRNRTPRPRP